MTNLLVHVVIYFWVFTQSCNQYLLLWGVFFSSKNAFLFKISRIKRIISNFKPITQHTLPCEKGVVLIADRWFIILNILHCQHVFGLNNLNFTFFTTNYWHFHKTEKIGKMLIFGWHVGTYFIENVRKRNVLTYLSKTQGYLWQNAKYNKYTTMVQTSCMFAKNVKCSHME